MAVDVQPQTETSTTEYKAKRYAVVVGINDYTEAGIVNLSFCAADAEAFYDSLITYCEYNPDCVILFSDGPHEKARKPLRSNILAAISDMSTRASEDDSILVFFACHGTRDARDSYLLTQEFRMPIIADTSIPMGMINDYLRQSKAKFIMRFFDACHAGRIGTRAAPPVGPDIKKHFLVEGEGWATLSACKEDQYAHEDAELGHGIFSYCLIKGLSGEAAADNEVTFHSLSNYTITKTLDITNELGLIQIPVLESGIAGDQVLATVRDLPRAEVPEALVKVQETTIEQLKPTPEKMPQFISDIRSILQNEIVSMEYVAPSQETKLAFGAKLVQQVYNFCQEQERLYHEQLQGIASVTIKQQSIKECPFNLKLAEYLEFSKFKQAMGLELIYQIESPTRQKLTGITEKDGQYESAVWLTIGTNKPLMPVCAMVMAIIPTTFGLYFLRYSGSTRFNDVQKEYWDPVTFTVRTLHAIPFTDTEGTQTLAELQDLFPQLVSFLAESCSARRTSLQNIGASGQSLI